MCRTSVGLCQKSRPLAWAKRKAVYTAVTTASTAVIQPMISAAPVRPVHMAAAQSVSASP